MRERESCSWWNEGRPSFSESLTPRMRGSHSLFGRVGGTRPCLDPSIPGGLRSPLLWAEGVPSLPDSLEWGGSLPHLFFGGGGGHPSSSGSLPFWRSEIAFLEWRGSRALGGGAQGRSEIAVPAGG